MASPNTGTEKLHSTAIGRLLSFLPVLAVLAPWTAALMHTALHADHAWLLIAAGRLLDGGNHLRDFFEPNPPMSILLYVPDVLLSRATGIPLWYTPYIAGLVALALSAAAVFALLQKANLLDGASALVVTGAYVLASTYLATAPFFTERDEFVVWGLAPFLIAQLAMTEENRLSGWLMRAALAVGAVCIMIKPFYAVLPAIALVHRAWRRKNMVSIMRDPDFLALAGAAGGYILVTVLFFPDFITYVLPDLLRFYVSVRHPAEIIAALPKGIVLALLLLAAWKLPLADDARRMTGLCALASFVSADIFVFQGKGVHDHLIPALVFFYCGFGILVRGWAFPASRDRNMAVFCALAALSFLAWVISPIEPRLLTHAEYRQLKLPRLAAEAGPKGSFYVFGESFEMVPQASLYTSVPHASRFSNLWWLAILDDPGTKEKAATYVNYVAEDLGRYKPQIIADQVNMKRNSGEAVDLVDLFDRYPAFRQEMAHYRKTEQMIDNRRDYFRGTSLDFDYPVVYDIYRRIPDSK